MRHHTSSTHLGLLASLWIRPTHRHGPTDAIGLADDDMGVTS